MRRPQNIYIYIYKIGGLNLVDVFYLSKHSSINTGLIDVFTTGIMSKLSSFSPKMKVAP